MNEENGQIHYIITFNYQPSLPLPLSRVLQLCDEKQVSVLGFSFDNNSFIHNKSLTCMDAFRQFFRRFCHSGKTLNAPDLIFY